MVVDQPPDGDARDRGITVGRPEEPTPLGFVAAYLGLTLLLLTVAFMARSGWRSLLGTAGPGPGIAYGRRAAADFWVEPVPDRTGRGRRSAPG